MTEKYARFSSGLLLACFFIFAFFLLNKPLTDPDMPWHLKTGEYIWQHKTIPATDPFSYAQDEIPFIGHFILTQYWLAQLFLYFVYTAFGAYGLIFTGAAIFTAIFALLAYLLRPAGVYLTLAYLGSFGLLILGNFVALRPQILTFLFTAVTIVLIEGFLARKTLRFIAPFPLLMLLWSNMHGGFIFGVVIMLIYLFSVVFTSLIGSRYPAFPPTSLTRGQIAAFAVATFLSCALSLLNPNTYHAFLYAFVTHSQKLFSMVSEYQTPLAMAKSNPTGMIIAYWALLPAILILVLYFIRQRLVTPALLLLFAVSLSFVGVRYISLFAIVATSVLRYLPLNLDRKLPLRPRIILNICLIAVLAASSAFSAQKLRRLEFHVLETFTYFPIGAAAFLHEKKISGNIFSSYNKSSYLLFKLFPESRLYADSRYISERRIGTMMAIVGANDTEQDWIKVMNMQLPPGAGSVSLSGTVTGKNRSPIALPEGSWDSLLDEISAEIIVHEALDAGSGLVHPFIWKLVISKEWELIYLDGTVMVFVRSNDKYRGVIQAYGKPKTAVYDEIIMESLPNLGSNNPQYAVNIALAQMLKGKTGADTKRLIDIALQMDQKNFFANYAMTLYVLLTSSRAGNN
ncbi:MAG: hypothetical protein OHK006_12450 [Thermodesulfovibrionales bacterium]